LSDVAFYPAIEDYWFIFLFDLIIWKYKFI
jgi:hypothetical protein